MKRKEVLTDEQRKELSKERELKEFRERVENGLIPAPTRLFKVGDEVKIGNLKNIFVAEVLFDGMGYRVEYDYTGQSYGRPIRVNGEGVWDWLSVFPISSFCAGEAMCVKDDVQIRFMNNDIDSLIHKVYYSGVDFNPEYQRGLVWNDQQKISLIDSIFNNVDIGKFTFIKKEYSPERIFYYEILDGKQRLSTICDFYEDRFSWRGKKFSELCAEDSRHFSSFPVVQGEVGEITEQQVYKLFVKMNTSGTPVSEEHLNKIKSLIIN
jgi:hypothetical protein